MVRDEHGRPGISDPDLADREWAANTDYSDAPASVVEAAAKYAAKTETPAPLSLIRPPPDEDEEDDDEPPTVQEGMSLSEANAAGAFWKAKLAEMKYREGAGELVPAKDVSKRLATVFHQCKTRLLGVPSSARQVLPHLTVADIDALDALIREALEDLAARGEQT